MIRRACKFVLFAGALATGGLIAASRPEKVTGSGVSATEDRAIGAVDEVTLSGMGNLVVTPGETPFSIVITPNTIQGARPISVKIQPLLLPT